MCVLVLFTAYAALEQDVAYAPEDVCMLRSDCVRRISLACLRSDSPLKPGERHSAVRIRRGAPRRRNVVASVCAAAPTDCFLDFDAFRVPNKEMTGHELDGQNTVRRKKAANSSGCEPRPGDRPLRPKEIGAAVESTKPPKPLVQRAAFGGLNEQTGRNTSER